MWCIFTGWLLCIVGGMFFLADNILWATDEGWYSNAIPSPKTVTGNYGLTRRGLDNTDFIAIVKCFFYLRRM